MKVLPLLFFVFLVACTESTINPIGSVQGYSPVYAGAEVIKKISSGSSRTTTLPGKIYAYKNFIFQNDVNNGIHIIDNSNPAQPKKVGYIDIPLSTEVAVKGDFLYSNNFDDLVVFDISNPADPKMVKRVEKVFPPANQTYPPFSNTAFECADPSKGIVVRWERKQLTDPKCRR